jgi:streptogramin lyase
MGTVSVMARRCAFVLCAKLESAVNKLLVVLLLCALFVVPAHAQTSPAAGYWWNPATPGSGFVIEIQGSQMFMAGFLYASSGEATWVASAGPMSSPTQYSGNLITYIGGQTLTGAYNGSPTPTAPFGNIAISFTDNAHGSVIWPGGTIPIERFDIVTSGSTTAQPATNPETGWWFNPNEGGRGFAVEVQNGSLYLAGYMYDSAGNPTWYLASGAMGSPTLFQGEWTQLGNGQTLTGSYVAPQQVNAMAGAVTLQFNNAYSATLTLPNSRQIPLIRYGFGATAPVLTSFGPAAAAPETQLTVSGTGFVPAATVTLTLSDSTGYGVTLPVDSVSTASVKVSVPPYILASSAAFASGTVNIQATQKLDGVSLATNTLPGFTIQSLPKASGMPGSSTLALIAASLYEAQNLQTSISGTAQATPAVTAALTQQVTNLQGLVTNIQSVVQSGVSYTLGAVGEVNIVVTPSNIGDVDSLILAALNALANPGSGSASKRAAQAPGAGCLAAEASAFAAAMTSGTGNLSQLAQNLLEAPQTDAACNTASAFGSAFQIFGGAADVGLGLANGAGGGVVGGRLPGAALFAATTESASAAVGFNALFSPTLASQASTVQIAIANVTAQSAPTANQLIAKSSGALTTVVAGAQNVVTVVAPPPVQTAAGTVTEFSARISAGANPIGIALGPDGNMWFVEHANDLIGRITPAGTVTEFSGMTPGAGPSYIALGADGNLWFTETGANRIGTITPTGTITEFSVGAEPMGIAAGADGNIWFTEYNAGRIGRITPGGTVTEFSAGINPTDGPTEMALGPDGNLWFTEFTGGIGRITPAGVITIFTTGITANARPVGICAGPDGNLWFTEALGNKIGRITPAGAVTEFSQGLSGSPQLNDITLGPDGNLWFTDIGANAVGRITPSGAIVEYSAGITANAEPEVIATGFDGNLWFTEFRVNRVGRIVP